MGFYSKHVVEVETKYITRNGKTVEESERRIESLGRGITRTTTQMAKMDSKGNAVLTTIERNTKGFQRFQMEHLGVMFAGMALNRAMANLNATAREWTGINELMGTAMGVVMLPATLDLLNLGVIPLFEALTNLPEPAKEAIGLVALALEGLGGVMMVGGQLALGLSSTMTVLEKIGGPAGAAAGARIALKKLAGISIIGIGVSLGIASVMAEDGKTALISALGSGVSIAIGAVLLGASATAGIALGALAITAILTWKLSTRLANKAKLYDDLGRDINEAMDFVTGEAQKRGAFPGGTRITRPPTIPGLENFQVDFSKLGGAGSTNQSVVINQSNNISGIDMETVKKEINKNNQTLTSEVRRIINVS